jgi:hypothetical protein
LYAHVVIAPGLNNILQHHVDQSVERARELSADPAVQAELARERRDTSAVDPDNAGASLLGRIKSSIDRTAHTLGLKHVRDLICLSGRLAAVLRLG